MLWTALHAFWLTLTRTEFRVQVTALIQSLSTARSDSVAPSATSPTDSASTVTPTPTAGTSPKTTGTPTPTAESRTKKSQLVETRQETVANVPVAPLTSARSDAVTLLETLQREARFVDFLMEPLDAATDAQVGAVARDIHRDCGKTLERLFAIEPATSQEEGETIEIPTGYDPGLYRVTGQTTSGTIRGTIVHPGWMVSRAELPKWNGRPTSEKIVAPIEVETR